jgi:hypothetical protein
MSKQGVMEKGSIALPAAERMRGAKIGLLKLTLFLNVIYEFARGAKDFAEVFLWVAINKQLWGNNWASMQC